MSDRILPVFSDKKQEKAMAKVIERTNFQSKKEEKINAATHLVSAALAVLGTVLLIIKCADMGALSIVSAALYGASMIILYSASSAYHLVRNGTRAKVFLQKFDHASIFLLITGTYIPGCWISMGGVVGWVVFGLVAGCGIVGIVLNCIDVKKFSKVCLVLYIVAGWTIAAALYPYYKAIGGMGILFLVLGGLLYTGGIFFYKKKKTPYMHAVWHVFVTLGSVMHYIMVYFYCY